MQLLRAFRKNEQSFSIKDRLKLQYHVYHKLYIYRARSGPGTE